jgi:hypothetical protein
VIVVPFKSLHLAAMNVQPAQARELVHLPPGALERLAEHPSLTGLYQGEPVACFGIVPDTLGSATMWAFLSADSGRHMLMFTRSALRFLELYPFRRVEATAPVEFGPGCKWLELLGFENEGRMRRYGADGADHYRYARVV